MGNVGYLPFRLLTCVPAVVISLTHNAPEEHLQFGLGLIVYAFALSVVVATSYTVILRSQWVGGQGSARSRRLVFLTLAVGVVDTIGGLWAIYQSGGWGSPFWHVSLASLIVPSVVFGIRYSFGVAAAYLGMQAIVLFLEGEGSVTVWLGPQRYLYVGTIATAFFVCAVVGYLGDVYYELDKSKRRVEAALGNLGTILEITKSVAVVTSGVDDMMRRVAQTIGERHRYDIVAIYLSEPGGRHLQLSGWLGNREEIERYARQVDGLMCQATATLDSRLIQDGESWRAAIPIRICDSLMGLLVVGSKDSDADVSDAAGLGGALAGHIAIGIQIAHLRQRLTDAATPEEWDRITREIHDGISGSIYGLMLHLETYADLARREGNPLSGSLEELLPPAKELLLDTRQYIFHLLPALRGESSLFKVVESLVWEFEKIAEMPVHLSTSGNDARVPAPVVAGLYHVLQHRMADVMRSPTASEFRVDLKVDPACVQLAVSDDGRPDDEVGAAFSRRIDYIRRKAGDIGGDLQVVDSEGIGTKIVVNLAIEDGRIRLDQLDNR